MMAEAGRRNWRPAFYLQRSSLCKEPVMFSLRGTGAFRLFSVVGLAVPITRSPDAHINR